jgi:prophage antirepressor-like protein
MNNQLQIFDNTEFGVLKVLTMEGKQYFPATECAETLGYSNPQDAVRRHCLEDGCVKHAVIDNLGRTQEMKFITEGNLYRLIVRSKLPAAVRFEKFVFDEVLPSIRKHGAYITDELLERLREDEAYIDELLNRLVDEKMQNMALYGTVKEMAPKVDYYDSILQCPGLVQTSIIAKDYGMSCTAFNRLLHNLGVQFKIGNTWLLYQKFADKGYTVSRTYRKGDSVSNIHTYWTQSGRWFLFDMLRWHGILPTAEKSDCPLPGGAADSCS